MYDAEIADHAQNGSGPGFVRYTRSEFEKLRRQHNILALVGNGFDIQTLADYEHPIDSRYETFYYYLQMRGFNSRNLLLMQMNYELRLHQQFGGHDSWSDIEAAVERNLKYPHAPGRIFDDLRAMQAEFAQFLQGVAPSTLLDQVGVDAAKNGLSLRSLAEFLGDVVDRDDFLTLDFPSRVSHYDLFNFQFVNFNYTTLLDNYIYLDQVQFDPLKHRTVDTNFTFRNDPRSYRKPGATPDEGYSGYVVSDVIHPHGVLSTPRSLLFGIDAPDDYKQQARNDARRLEKPYWSQAHALYRNHFLQADLFVIFGCSLGQSDGWWWRNIVRGLRNTKSQTPTRGANKGQTLEEFSELIIYRRQEDGRHSVDSVRDRFLDVAGVSAVDPDRQWLADRIHVVIYDDSTDRAFLNTRRQRDPG
ncbi:AbiH family protein [Aeromicrobium sp. HA]|uniref:AbiH family protein n=1 Tax=Aeromicrobium sp. HA TaxID=3009077 RepID=UPI0022AE5F87|nr:AbiH family protein [Aeromicrobium sp. HA]